MLPDALTAQQLTAVAYPDLKWTLNELPAGNLAHYKLHDPEAPELAELVLSPFISFGRVPTSAPDDAPVPAYHVCVPCHTYLVNRRRRCHANARLLPEPPPPSLQTARRVASPMRRVATCTS